VGGRSPSSEQLTTRSTGRVRSLTSLSAPAGRAGAGHMPQAGNRPTPGWRGRCSRLPQGEERR
jgi:hypothetical protein